jgi:hypothetical protein
MTGFKVTAPQLRSYAIYLGTIVGMDVVTAMSQADEGTNRSGFSGLLEPLKAAMSLLEQASNEVLQAVTEKLDNLAEGLSVTADNYEHIDHKHAKNMLMMDREPAMRGGHQRER